MNSTNLYKPDIDVLASQHPNSQYHSSYWHLIPICVGFPWLSGKESAYHAGATGDMGSIPGLGRCPGGGHSNPLQYP